MCAENRGRAAGEPPRWLNEEQLLVHRDPAVLVDDDESAVRRLQRIPRTLLRDPKVIVRAYPTQFD